MSGATALALFVIGIAATAVAMVLMWPRKTATAPEPNRPPRRTIEVIELTVMPGAYFEKWCDDCNRTHGWVNVYAYEGDDPSQARHIATAPVADDWDEQDGGAA